MEWILPYVYALYITHILYIHISATIQLPALVEVIEDGSVVYSLLLQAKACLQKDRQQPIPQRGATVTCLVSFLNLQTRGGQIEGERSNKGTCERAQGVCTPRLTNWQLQGVGEMRKLPNHAYTLHTVHSYDHADNTWTHINKNMSRQNKFYSVSV